MATNYHKYDKLAARVRTAVAKFKYGSASRMHIVNELREMADAIEQEHKQEVNNANQERLEL